MPQRYNGRRRPEFHAAPINLSFTYRAQSGRATSPQWTRSMASLLKQFAADQTGATSIEYALIAVLVGIAIISAVTALGSSLKSIFTTVSSTVNTASS